MCLTGKAYLVNYNGHIMSLNEYFWELLFKITFWWEFCQHALLTFRPISKYNFYLPCLIDAPYIQELTCVHNLMTNTKFMLLKQNRL